MRFYTEEKRFKRFCLDYGARAVILSRVWDKETLPAKEVLVKSEELPCLLSRWEKTLPEIDPAAVSRARAVLYLPGEAEIKAGDAVEVSWGSRKKCQRFMVAGEPEYYPPYTKVRIVKEERV